MEDQIMKKPTPPPSLMIRDGVNPFPRSRNTPSFLSKLKKLIFSLFTQRV